MMKFFVISCAIFIGLILLIVLIMGISGVLKKDPVAIMGIVVFSMLFLMLCLGIGNVIKSKQWSFVVYIGYFIIFCLVSILLISRMDYYEGWNFSDLGIIFGFVVFSVFIYKVVNRMSFYYKVIDLPLKMVREASINSLNQLGLVICDKNINSSISCAEFEIIAQDPKIKETADFFPPIGMTEVDPPEPLKIKINLKELSETSVIVKIRVGFFGNLRRSREIFETIKKCL